MAGAGKKRQTGFGIALVLVSSVCWSSMPVLIRVGLNSGIGEIPLNTVRLIIGACALGLFLLFFPRRSSHAMPPGRVILLILLGALDYGLGGILFFAGIRYLGASLASLLIFIYPALVVIISAALGWDRITLPLLLALLLTFCGAAFVLEAGFVLTAETWIGVAYVLGSVLIFTVYVLFCERLLDRYSSAHVSFYSLVGGAAAMLALLLLFPVPLGVITRLSNMLLFAFIGVVGTALSLIMFLMGIRRIGASRAAIITTIEPLFIVTMAWLLLQEGLSALQLFGMLLQLCGIALLKWERAFTAETAP